MRICLVTEEVASAGSSGGIGGAIEELAMLLARNGATVDVLCAVPPSDPALRDRVTERFAGRGVALKYLDTPKYTWSQTLAGRSLAVYEEIESRNIDYDFIHFHEYHGVGYFLVRAKHQGIAFQNTSLVVQCHGSVEWALEGNQQLPSEDEHLQVFHLERESIAGADILVSPSAYLIDWMKQNGYQLPVEDMCFVIQNVCTGMMMDVVGGSSSGTPTRVESVNEIIMFGRHEPRKGFVQFLDGITKANDVLTEHGVKVTFLGKFGKVVGQHSGSMLTKTSKAWNFDFAVYPNKQRYDAMRYLRSRPNAVVFVPSPFENSPYTVLEAVALGKALVTSTDGGAGELINTEFHEEVLIDINAENIALKIADVLENGAAIPVAARNFEETEEEWLSFHNNFRLQKTDTIIARPTVYSGECVGPKVVVGITHYERPTKLIDSLLSVTRQTYKNIEIVVLDDGSKSESTKTALAQMEPMIERIGARLIRAENGYLGAARNKIAAATDSEFLCFLDDDDIAHPELISRLVSAAETSSADIMNCLNVFMPEKDRARMMRSDRSWRKPVSYVPTAGPIELAPTQNVFGAATALIRRSVFEAIGGYTELRGVGHEDYEFFVRSAQEGFKLDVTPQRLYLYEVDRPSMISRTSSEANFLRVVKALDTSKNLDSWQRLMMRISGANAKVNEENRRIWESQVVGNFPFEEPLFAGGLSVEGELQCLARLAEHLNADSALHAYEDALKSHEARIEDGKSGRSRFREAAIRRDDGQEGALRRFEARWSQVDDTGLDASVALIDLLRSHWSLTREDWYLIEQLLASGRASSAQLEELRMLIFEKLDDSDIPHGLPVIFEIANKLDDSAGMTDAVELAIEIDSEQYLELNVDVARAIETGDLNSAFDHYASSGAKEYRGGFYLVRNLLAVGPDFVSKIDSNLQKNITKIQQLASTGFEFK